ncbi:hypothetical protein TIFTF001_012721 [Ficus carica]|uniref:Ubiquitin-like domain-containing protein n=1 Tax=Ficus carica TaxID=3494 RepID=A0AA88A0I8_FICCA|nr:hypothetical protein TIFTF001_012721 [Ficus carica]
MEENKLQIFVHTLRGKTIVLHVDKNEGIRNVKAMIHMKGPDHIPWDRQILICGRILRDDLTLSDYSIQSNSTLFLNARLPPCPLLLHKVDQLLRTKEP